MTFSDARHRILVAGRAEGEVLWSDVPLSFWMGVDMQTGEVVDAHHPLRGARLAGKVVALPSGRGSCSGSCALLELILNGNAPAALVLERADAILALGAVVAEAVFGRSLPVVVAGGAAFADLRGASRLAVGGDEAPTASAGPALTDRDAAVLAGAEGRARQAAMGIVVRMAALMGAPSLLDVTQAHIDGCFYTGPGGLAFAERLRDWGGRVAVPSTTNAASVDARLWRQQGVDAAFGEAAGRVADAYVGMGVRPTFTCAPYLLASAPTLGQQVAWGESNAVAYANGVLGARTMKYPDLLDICVALTGRAPCVDAHTAAGRRATLRVVVSAHGASDDAFWPLLGHVVGEVAAQDVPLVAGLERTSPSADDLKAFAAAFATTSAAPMFHILGVTPEAATVAAATGGAAPGRVVAVTGAELARGWGALNTAASAQVDVVALGNPHFSLTEFARAAALCRGRTASPGVTMVVTCGRDIYAEAERTGHVAALERFGARVLVDTCWCMIGEPVLPPAARTIATNSAKYAHYAPGMTGRGVHFGGLASCIDAASTGRMDLAAPAWLGEAPQAGRCR